MTANVTLATQPYVTNQAQINLSDYGEQLHMVEAAELQFAESLDLKVVLARVAQQIAALFGGVCQVRFTPPHRPLAARQEVAGPGESQACHNDTPSTTYASLVARLYGPVGAQGEGRPDAAQVRGSGGAELEGYCGESQGAALLVAPLAARGRRIGTIDLVLPARDEAALLGSQVQLRVLAAHAALAIDTADRFAQLRQQESAPGSPDANGVNKLLAMLVHDIRNPLTALSSSIQMLARMAGGAQELQRGRVAHLTDVAEAALAQLESQISGLLPATDGLTRGEGPATAVDLVRLARVMANFYQQTTARHRLIVRASAPELTGPWSRAHLERVLGNLLTNAIKYSPAGGSIEVLVGREHDERGPCATLRVQNEGIGIPPQDLPQIAQPGYRGRNVGSIPGTGFGLASVREVVERYGGTIAIQSAAGGITTVLVRLPLA